MKTSATGSYAINVEGESMTDWSGSRPENIDSLLNRPDKDITALQFMVTKTQVELLCQKGDTLAATEILAKYKKDQEEAERGYKCPLNVFQRDNQNGKAPYQGAHCFFGAFRDAAGHLNEIYYKKAADRGTKASDKHLRKFVRIVPNHVFLYRNGKKITEVDGIEGQQPSEDVKGFAKYEVIKHPFTFKFRMQIIPAGPFKEFLADRDKVIEALKCSTFNGEGSRRSAGYGGWRITKAEVENWSPDQA